MPHTYGMPCKHRQENQNQRSTAIAEGQKSTDPYADTHAVDIRRQEESVFLLIGKIIEMKDGHGLQIAPGIILPVDAALLPVLEFFRAARLEHQARAWLKWAEAPEGLLAALVNDGYLVKIDASSEFQAAGSLRNVRLVPSAEAQRGERVVLMYSGDTPGSGHPHFYLMLPGEDGVPWKASSVSGDLADVLWENSKGRSVHRAILRLALKGKDDVIFVVNRVLAALPWLIESECAHLEMVRVPRRVKAKAVNRA